MKRHAGRRGLKTLNAIARDHTIGAHRTRSELEARFLAFLTDHDLPRPQTNTTIDGYECDCVWRTPRVIVELDGHAAHATRRTFERDRIRDRRLQRAGWRPIRVTWRQLHQEPEGLARDLRALLA